MVTQTIIAVIGIVLVFILGLNCSKNDYKQGFDDGVRYALKQVSRVVNDKEREAHEKSD